jgi:outer membrane lipoprotein-sorting protein
MRNGGELNAVLEGAPRLRTLQGALTTWLDRGSATASEPAQAGGPVRGPALPRTLARDIETLTSSYVVVAPPDRWRVVARGLVVVSNGKRSWVGTSTLVTERDSARALIDDAGAIGACLHVGRLLAANGVTLGDLGEPETAVIEGRACLVVDVFPGSRAGASGGPTGGPLHRDLAGADHRLWLDVATGIVLRHEGSVDGKLCSWTQLGDIVIDARLADDEFQPPPGAVVRSHHELLRDHLSDLGIDPDTVDLDDPVQVRRAIRHLA